MCPRGRQRPTGQHFLRGSHGATFSKSRNRDHGGTFSFSVRKCSPVDAAVTGQHFSEMCSRCCNREMLPRGALRSTGQHFKIRSTGKHFLSMALPGTLFLRVPAGRRPRGHIFLAKNAGKWQPRGHIFAGRCNFPGMLPRGGRIHGDTFLRREPRGNIFRKCCPVDRIAENVPP